MKTRKLFGCPYSRERSSSHVFTAHPRGAAAQDLAPVIRGRPRMAGNKP
jgi:hypothetical protein